MVNILQFDGLACITGLGGSHSRLILSQQTASPHALFDVLILDQRRGNAGRRTKFAPVKSLDSSEFSSGFSGLKTFANNVKVNPVIS